MNLPARTTSPLAVVSLVTGLLSWVILPLVGALVAIVCGHMARGEIRRDPDRLDGDGLALAGLILGWVNIALMVLTVLAILLFFGGLAAFLAFVAAQGG